MKEGSAISAESRRTLILLRHAKSAYPPGVADHERPLAGRGEREAALAGAWIADRQLSIDRILCSTAERTRQTAAVAGLTGPPAPTARAVPTAPTAPITYTEDIYDAYPDELEDLIRTVDPAERTVVLIGHAPGLPGLAEDLAGSGSDEAALSRMRSKFPTSAVAVLSVDGEWADVGRGATTSLVDFVIPRS
jgi:phosphohistidine phosphatase